MRPLGHSSTYECGQSLALQARLVFLLIFIPVLFTVLGALIGYAVARLQGLKGRAVWAQVAGGAFGGLVGGLLTVPFLGTAAAVSAAVATTAPAGTAGLVGTATEWTALSLGQAAGSASGQAATNLVNGDPFEKDLLPAAGIGFGSQLVLTPIGDKAVLALTPIVPAASRMLLLGLARAGASVPARVIATEVGGVAVKRIAGETTTEALTDGATMVVPMPQDDSSKEPRSPGMTAALGKTSSK